VVVLAAAQLVQQGELQVVLAQVAKVIVVEVTQAATHTHQVAVAVLALLVLMEVVHNQALAVMVQHHLLQGHLLLMQVRSEERRVGKEC
jgi:hypothetical protein